MKRAVSVLFLLGSALSVRAEAEDPTARELMSRGTEREGVFHLPFPPGVSHRVLFGPGDGPHHLSPRNRHAYDFDMAYGSEVCASAPGLVVRAVGHNAGPTGRSQDNNFVAIRHADGSISEYHHLMQDGVLVMVGERVERGEVIGFSGSSGRAEGPHLHFVVLRDEKSVSVRLAECVRAPRKGDICTSRNVPEGEKERGVFMEEVLSCAKALRAMGVPPHVRSLFAGIHLKESARRKGGSLAERRSAMAIGPLERKVDRALKEIAGG